MELKSSPPQIRCYGIDLLRLVAAFYMMILHTLIQGGVADGIAAAGSAALDPCRFLRVSATCSVNIFGLISGYVGYSDSDRPYSPVSHGMLWLQVVFYAVGINSLFFFTRPDVVTPFRWVSAFLPFSTNLYWYFTSYSVLLLFAPLLNTAVRHSRRGELLAFLLAVVFIVCSFESVTGKLYFNDGYSFGWLLVLYLCGTIMKKENLGSRLHPGLAVLGILAIDLCLYLLEWNPTGSAFIQRRICDRAMTRYSFPLYLICAMLHVIAFAKLPTGKLAERLIRFAAPGAFSVYIVNTHPLMWHYVNHDRYVSWAALPGWEIALRTLGTALGYVIAVVSVDCFRRWLFGLLRIKPCLQRISAALSGFVRKKLPLHLDM